MSGSIWATLSAIDCKEHIEKKGQFSYLAWTWAWAMVKENYPESTYELQPDITYQDGTMEVRVRVFINETAHTMWLPVLDFKNKAIQNPNAFDINSARMRCLVKCLAMFGLGHYIYAGESSPQEPVITFTPEQKAQYTALLASEDGFGLKKFANDVGNDVMSALFNSSPQGQKTAIKAKCREVVQAANNELKATVAAIQGVLASPEASYDSIEEIYSELGEVEADFVQAALNEVEHRQIDNLRVSA